MKIRGIFFRKYPIIVVKMLVFSYTYIGYAYFMQSEVRITKINIYYGGRGLLEDPTIYVINKMTEVLKDLRVEVERYNIFEDKNAIATLPSTLKGVDGVILATGSLFATAIQT